tara:strand:+ start:4079 stop:4453 length:375 start_codon:yes stop_codon:yes gene_type:complete
MSSKIDLNDIDIDYWTFDLGGYTDNLYKEIIIFDITREDLLNNNGDNLKEIGRMDSGDWDTFGSILSEDEAKIEKKETENYINSVKEDDSNGDVEYKYYINTTYLYCENQYIHSVSSYEREEVY